MNRSGSSLCLGLIAKVSRKALCKLGRLFAQDRGLLEAARNERNKLLGVVDLLQGPRANASPCVLKISRPPSRLGLRSSRRNLVRRGSVTARRHRLPSSYARRNTSVASAWQVNSPVKASTIAASPSKSGWIVERRDCSSAPGGQEILVQAARQSRSRWSVGRREAASSSATALRKFAIGRPPARPLKATRWRTSSSPIWRLRASSVSRAQFAAGDLAGSVEAAQGKRRMWAAV